MWTIDKLEREIARYRKHHPRPKVKCAKRRALELSLARARQARWRRRHRAEHDAYLREYYRERRALSWLQRLAFRLELIPTTSTPRLTREGRQQHADELWRTIRSSLGDIHEKAKPVAAK